MTWAAGAGALAYLFVKVKARLELSKAKHPSLRGHARMSRLAAKLVPFYDYDEEAFFSSDDAPPEIVARRREGFWRLVKLYQDRFAETRRLTEQAAPGISDLQFTAAYRVPFQYRTLVGRHLKSGSFYRSSSGVTLTDADGNTLHDVSGSYGVNVLGNDFYKGCIERGAERVRDLGPVLGSYHPVVADNVERLRKISGLDEVSFHMSGTEAVMQAVRLARYHTRRSRLVRFCGSYHGWWGDVQPGVGNPTPARDTYTLKDMDEDALRVLRRRRDIACVLVNPLQALHPNASAPTDSTLVDSSRGARFDRAAYTAWLKRLREVCTARGIVLIFDEVFVGFRLARGGAQEYFGVRADLVTYGKTLGGGLPVGALCGRKELMRRFRDERPADICFARGTFNSHPYVMGAMQRVPRQPRTARDCRALRRPRRRLGWPRRALERAPARRGPAAPGRQHVHHLDDLVHAALPLQLDAAVLPARRGPRPQLGRHRPPHLQPRLQRGRLRSGRRQAGRRGEGDARRRLLVGGRGVDQQGDQTPHPSGGTGAPLPACSATTARTGRYACCFAGSMSSPRIR